MRKNIFFTFLTACVPGAGQMYLTYMKRGLSLMGLFFGVIAVSWLFGTESILIALPVIWAYAFFDTFHLRNATPQQLEQMPDDYLFHLSALKNYDFSVLSANRHTLLGAGLILVACLMLYNGVLVPMLWYLLPNSFLGTLLSYVPEIVLAALLVLLGLWLLRGPRSAKPKEDFTAYTGAAAAPAAPDLTALPEAANADE